MTTTTTAPAVRVGLADLAQAVKVLNTVPPVRSALAIVNTVRACATDGTLEFEVNTLDRGAIVRVSALGFDLAPVLIDRAKLAQAIKAIGASVTAAVRRTTDVTLRIGEHGPELCGPSGTIVNVGPDIRADVADYMARPDLAPVRTSEHDGATLAGLVAAVTPGASRDDMLPSLTSVRITHSAGGGLHMLATDRYRLHMAATANGDHQEPGVLVPARWLTAVAKVLGSRVTMANNARTLTLTFDGVTVWTETREDCEFPNVMRLFPTDAPVQFTVNRAQLLAAVRAMAPLCPRNTPVHLTIGTDCIVVRNGDMESPAEAAPVPADVTDRDGAVPSIALNPGFLADTLSVTDSTMVTISGTHPHKPFLFDHTADVRVLLVPLRMGL